MDSTLKQYLYEDEKLLWSGKAASFETLDKTYKPDFIKKVLVAVVILATVTIAYALLLNGSAADFKVGVPLVVLLLTGIVPLHVLTDAGKIRKITYAATNQRLLVQSGDSVRGVDYGRIDQAAFKTDAAGVISLLCGSGALKAKECKYREIAVLGMTGGDMAEEGKPIESFGFYALDKKDEAKLRAILKEHCPAIGIM